MPIPLVSCLMPTFGRSSTQPHLINESVYWFCRLDYPRKELIILNHAQGVEMRCDVPGVRVVNWSEHIPYLSRKMQMLVDMAGGEILLPFEDDDISLPWRAEQVVKHLEGYSYWCPQAFWYSPSPSTPMVPCNKGVAHTCGGYRKEGWGGYRKDVTQGHDGVAKKWALENVRRNPEVLTDPADLSFIYRWGVSMSHLSGHGDNASNAYDKQKAGPPGVYQIEPVPYVDWVAEHHARKGLFPKFA